MLRKIFGKKNGAVICLYQQLSVEKAELAKKHTPNGRDSDTLLPNVLKTLDEIERVVVDLENAIDDVLKRSHVLQWSAVEENLYDHKAKFIALYQELNDEMYQLENHNQTITNGDDLTSFWARIGQTIKEVERLREMRQIVAISYCLTISPVSGRSVLLHNQVVHTIRVVCLRENLLLLLLTVTFLQHLPLPLQILIFLFSSRCCKSHSKASCPPTLIDPDCSRYWRGARSSIH
ncbi:hypothetical protein AAC387_Pa07g0264 [Persea americana]